MSERWLVQQLRARALTFTALGGDRLQDLIGDRLYLAQAADHAVYPYVVLGLQHVATFTDGGYRQLWSVEWLVLHRDRGQYWEASWIADVLEQAFLRWRVATSTALVLAQSQQAQRATLPPAPAPMDRELVQVRYVVPCIVWPAHLTPYEF